MLDEVFKCKSCLSSASWSHTVCMYVCTSQDIFILRRIFSDSHTCMVFNVGCSHIIMHTYVHVFVHVFVHICHVVDAATEPGQERRHRALRGTHE